ncbi:MAG: FAD-binding protein, partial [Muribaculum sp.]|nr:FAD-binding protein [Muribaculum sp.]
MIQEINIRVSPREAAETDTLRKIASQEVRVEESRIKGVRIVRRSIDARQRRVMVNLSLRIYTDESIPDTVDYEAPVYADVHNAAHSAIIVGAGPGGLFAALRLIELGVKPILLERGKSVDERLRDMAAIARSGEVNPDSNYCFGEGGAGAYSDGKLYTRSKKRGSVDKILQVLHLHGASDDILVDAHPHIGTDKLPAVIKSMRERIVASGGEVYFSTRVTDLLLSADGKKIEGVETADGRCFYGPVILATGHSARDVYRMLNSRGVRLEPKGIAIGVRLEHPQSLIDRIQYHSPDGRGRWLPAAEYSMLTRVDDRAVYSFCMCPGGFIIPAASEPGQLVVNGMSPSNRGTRWSNSGMVVEILPDDIPDRNNLGALKMMGLQEEIEQKFFNEDGGSQNAPAQRMT